MARQHAASVKRTFIHGEIDGPSPLLVVLDDERKQVEAVGLRGALRRLAVEVALDLVGRRRIIDMASLPRHDPVEFG